jgi:ubiquinone biosynthesis protein
MTKLTRLFIDAANENVEALPRRLGELGVRYDKRREDEFVGYLRELYTRYYGARLAEIDPLQLIREGFQLIYAMNLQLPSRFILLDKAIATLGSVGVDLYPDFNVFEVAKPYARNLLRERFTPSWIARRARKEAIGLAHVASELPYQLHDVLDEMRDGQIEVGFRHEGLDVFMQRMTVSFNRLVLGIVIVGGLIGSALIGTFADKGPHALGLNLLAYIGFGLSGLLLVRLLWGIFRSGRV